MQADILQEFVPEIVELQTEPKQVQAYMVELLESLVKTRAHVSVIFQTLGCMRSLLSDDTVANVRKAAIMASVTVFRAAFGVVSQSGTAGPFPQITDMWRTAVDLKADIQSLMSSQTATDSVRHMAMKFVEQCVMISSAEELPYLAPGSNIQSLRLTRIPRPHALLYADQVRKRCFLIFHVRIPRPHALLYADQVREIMLSAHPCVDA